MLILEVQTGGNAHRQKSPIMIGWGLESVKSDKKQNTQTHRKNTASSATSAPQHGILVKKIDCREREQRPNVSDKPEAGIR
jgi:hypothetical protein